MLVSVLKGGAFLARSPQHGCLQFLRSLADLSLRSFALFCIWPHVERLHLGTSSDSEGLFNPFSRLFCRIFWAPGREGLRKLFRDFLDFPKLCGFGPQDSSSKSTEPKQQVLERALRGHRSRPSLLLLTPSVRGLLLEIQRGFVGEPTVQQTSVALRLH